MIGAPLRLRMVGALALVVLSAGCGAQGSSDRRPTSGQPTTTYSFSIIEGKAPAIVFLGRERLTEIVLQNDGYLAWHRKDGFYLSPSWMALFADDVLEEGFRTPVDEDVAPGARARVLLRMKPPETAGLYRVHWDLQSEGSGWFARFDQTPEPPRLVLVLPRVEFFSAVLLPLFLLAAAVVAHRRRFEYSGAAAGFLVLMDLCWCALSLWGKPYVLYGELAAKFRPGPNLVTFSVIAFLLLPLAFLPARKRAIVSWLLAVGGALTVWTQLLYHRFFRDLASSVAALAGRQTTELGSTIGSLTEARDVWLLIDLAVAIPVLFVLARGARPRLGRAPRWMPVLLALLAMPFLWQTALALSSGEVKTRRNLQNLRSVSTYGLFGFQILDAGTSIVGRFRASEATEQELRRALGWFEGTASDRRASGPAAGAAEGLNLIGIQVESMQGFVLDLDIDGVPVTPNLRRLAQSGLDFAMVLDQTSRGRSSAGDFVTMTSLLPIGESIAYEHPSNEYYAIAHALADRGYRTLSAIPYKGRFWNRQVTHASYGFETRLFEEQFEARGQRVGWGINDRDFLDQMVPILENLEQPFFAWLTTLSVHYPYESFPDGLRLLDLGKLEGTSLGNYLHGMSFFDRALGEFLDRLEANGLLQRSVVAIWGDHASGMERDPQFLDYFGLETPVDKFLFRRVPFVVALPRDRSLAGRDTGPAGQVDIAPTLLALMGVDAAELAMMGRNLLGESTSRLVTHPQGRWIDRELLHLSQFADSDGGCWSTPDGVRVAARRCADGTAATETQLDIVSLVLERNLQSAVTRRLREETKP